MGRHIHAPSIEGSERPFLLVALLLILAIAGVSYRGWLAFQTRSEQSVVAQRTLEATNAVVSALADAETGQRGFLLTGSDIYLKPYRRALQEIPALLDSLTETTTRRPEQLSRLDKLRPLIRNKLDELKETIETFGKQGPAAARAIVLTDRGQALMDQIRQVSSEIKTEATGRLLRESDQALTSADQLGFVSVTGSAGLFVLLVLSAITIQRGALRRQELIQTLQRSEESTRIAHDWLQTTVASIGDGVIATDASGKVTLINDVAVSLTGWATGDALGLPLEQIFVLTDEAGLPAENPATKVQREGRVATMARLTMLTSKDGRHIPIDDSAAPIRDAAGEIAGVVLVFRDITQRREAESLRKKATIDLARLAAIVESSHDAIIGKNLQGIVTSWNPGAERIFGYTKEEMIGRPISTLAVRARADEMPRLLERIARGEHVKEFETIRRTKDGREIHISLTVSPIRDNQGRVVGASKIARDISERIASERELRQQAELLARSNADLQDFAYAASHDLREPLRTITLYSQLLERNQGPNLDAEGAEHLQAVRAAAARMTQLIEGLLDYTKISEPGASSVEEIDTEAALAAALGNLQAAIEQSQASITHDPFPRVRGSHLHFAQLLQNLIGNALKYRGPEPPAIFLSAKREDAEWLFSVSDNGPGIPSEYSNQIFELFRRLHGQEYPGSGIGLATCKKIVERQGGRMWVESKPGAGATFFFTVPISS